MVNSDHRDQSRELAATVVLATLLFVSYSDAEATSTVRRLSHQVSMSKLASPNTAGLRASAAVGSRLAIPLQPVVVLRRLGGAREPIAAVYQPSATLRFRDTIQYPSVAAEWSPMTQGTRFTASAMSISGGGSWWVGSILDRDATNGVIHGPPRLGSTKAPAIDGTNATERWRHALPRSVNVARTSHHIRSFGVQRPPLCTISAIPERAIPNSQEWNATAAMIAAAAYEVGDDPHEIQPLRPSRPAPSIGEVRQSSVRLEYLPRTGRTMPLSLGRTGGPDSRLRDLPVRRRLPIPFGMVELRADYIATSSGFAGRAYQDPALKLVVAGLRGTEPYDWRDIRADIGYVIRGFGRHLDAQRADALDFVRSLAAKYTDHQIIVVGHSLAGMLAQDVSAKTGLRAVTFGAPGMRSYIQSRGIDLRAAGDQVINHVSSADPLGNVGQHVGPVEIWEGRGSGPVQAHGIQSYMGEYFLSPHDIQSGIELLTNLIDDNRFRERRRRP